MEQAPPVNPLSAELQKLGLSQLELAARLDVSSSYLRQVERGAVRHPSLLLAALAELGCDARRLGDEYQAWRSSRFLVGGKDDEGNDG